MKLFSWSMLLLMVFVFSACGGDDEDESKNAIECTQTALAEALDEQFQSYSTAFFSYLEEQSSDNCKALKSSAEEYVQFYIDNKDCIEELTEEVIVDEEIDELELGLESLEC